MKINPHDQTILWRLELAAFGSEEFKQATDEHFHGIAAISRGMFLAASLMDDFNVMLRSCLAGPPPNQQISRAAEEPCPPSPISEEH